MVVAGVLSNELSKQGGVVAEVAVEAATGGAGGARPSALTAAEWDDRGEHDYTSFGCSPSLRTFRCLSSRPRHAVAAAERRRPGGGAMRWWTAAVRGVLWWTAATLWGGRGRGRG